MSIFSTILASLVALEALYIMQLEMFASKEKLENVFGLSKEYLSMEETRVSMKNQGLYNGFIGVGLLFSRFFFPVNSQFIGYYNVCYLLLLLPQFMDGLVLKISKFYFCKVHQQY